MNSELLDDLNYLDEKRAPLVYVGFWLRLGAGLLDSVALSFILMLWGIVLAVLGAIIPASIIDPVGEICSGIIMFLYFPFWESSRSQGSIGKQILGVKVIGEDGEGLSFWRALARFVAKFLSYTIALIGFIMIAFTDKKRGLHDMIANTYVVRR
jgi:uncharacterized RDD family membrane protein YckC